MDYEKELQKLEKYAIGATLAAFADWLWTLSWWGSKKLALPVMLGVIAGFLLLGLSLLLWSRYLQCCIYYAAKKTRDEIRGQE
jgi:hypothetical protein